MASGAQAGGSRRAPSLPLRVGTVLVALTLAGCHLPWPWLGTPAGSPWAAVRSTHHPQFQERAVARLVVLPFEIEQALPQDAEPVRQAVARSFLDLRWCEVVAPSPRELRHVGHDPEVADEDARIDQLIRLRAAFHADAALYGTVTFRRRYAEPALGLRLLMVDLRDGDILWTADDCLDTLDPWVREALYWSVVRAESRDAADWDPDGTPYEIFTRFVAESYAVSLVASTPASPHTSSTNDGIPLQSDVNPSHQ